MSRCPCLGRRSKGFSLIELLVVVAVIALLTGLALPGYQAYLQRARRTDAREALLRSIFMAGLLPRQRPAKHGG